MKKLLLVTCLLGVSVLAAVPLSAMGSVQACHEVLLRVDAITALARMQIDLDVAKAGRTAQAATLSMLYKRKKLEALQLPGMSEAKLAELLKSKILQLQGFKDPAKEEAIQAEKESRAAIKSLFFSKTHSSQTFESNGWYKYLSGDEKTVVVLNGKEADVIDLKSGKVKANFKDQSQVMYSAKQDLLIAIKDRTLSTLELRTQAQKSFELKEVPEWSDVNSRRPRYTLSADQQSLVAYNDTHYYIFDLQTGSKIYEAKFAVKLDDETKVKVLNKDSWLLYGSGPLYHYNPKNGHWALLASGLEKAIPYASADGNQVLILVDGGLIYYDSVRAKVLSKHFTPQSWITDVSFGKDPSQFSFVLQHDSDFAEERYSQGLPMTEYMTLSTSDLSIVENIPWLGPNKIFSLPNNKAFVSSRYITPPTGIYSGDLKTVLQSSSFEFDYHSEAEIVITGLLSSKDGSKLIIFTENKTTEKPGFDIWETGK